MTTVPRILRVDISPPGEEGSMMTEEDWHRHDFKNHLAIIPDLSEILLAEAADSDPRRVEFDEIPRSGKRRARAARAALACRRRRAAMMRPLQEKTCPS